MPFQHKDRIRYYQFESLTNHGLTHGIFTRRGGLSPEPWDSLNVGGLLGDDPKRVYGNRVLSFQALGRDPDSVYDVWQVHGAEVISTRRNRPKDAAHVKADAILTDRPEVTLFMRFADCVPVVLFDPHRQVIGLVHAGWQGTVKGVVRATLERMEREYGVRMSNVLACIGPSIGVDHYEIGPEVARQVQEAFGAQAEALLTRNNGSIHFDLWQANRLILEAQGVSQVEVAGLCTACHPEDWYSHRGEMGKTGRFGGLIALPDQGA